MQSGRRQAIARIRWTWDLQRPRFRAAAISGPLPEQSRRQSGARLPEILAPNGARDVDLERRLAGRGRAKRQLRLLTDGMGRARVVRVTLSPWCGGSELFGGLAQVKHPVRDCEQVQCCVKRECDVVPWRAVA